MYDYLYDISAYAYSDGITNETWDHIEDMKSQKIYETFIVCNSGIWKYSVRDTFSISLD